MHRRGWQELHQRGSGCSCISEVLAEVVREVLAEVALERCWLELHRREVLLELPQRGASWSCTRGDGCIYHREELAGAVIQHKLLDWRSIQRAGWK